MSELNEEHKGKIRKLLSQTPEFCAHIEQEESIRFQTPDVIAALMEATGKNFEQLALDDWNNDKVLTEIKKTEYIQNFPIILGSVELEYSIIPNDVIRNINEEQVKFKGEKWVVHKNDADPFPSNPHAHNYEAGLKLHLGNGGLYNGTQDAGKVRCKDLKNLRNLFNSITMPTLEC